MGNPAIAPALIGAGSKLLGGILGRGYTPSAKRQYRDQRRFMEQVEKNKYRWIVGGAQAAGFNPLTALRAGGGNMSSPGGIIPQSPLSARSALGEAISTFGATYAQDAIQRASEERQQEAWKERYDYRRDEQGVPPLSAAPSSGQAKLENNDQEMAAAAQVGERLSRPPSGAFPQVDPFSERPADMRIGSGPNRDRFVIPFDGKFYMTPKGMGPHEGVESMIGDIIGNGASILQVGKDLADRGFDQVTWNPDTMEVVEKRPKGASKTRQRSTPRPPRVVYPQFSYGVRPPPVHQPLNTFPRTITDPNYRNLHPRKGTY